MIIDLRHVTNCEHCLKMSNVYEQNTEVCIILSYHTLEFFVRKCHSGPWVDFNVWISFWHKDSSTVITCDGVSVFFDDNIAPTHDEDFIPLSMPLKKKSNYKRKM